MSVVLYRIDDRLIHGQVMTAWSKVFKTKRIYCVDDETAANEMLVTVMQLAAPPGYSIFVLTTDEAAEKILADQGDERTMVLAKTPVTMLALLDAGVLMPELNVGNIGKGPGRKMLLRSIQVTAAEMAALREIEKRGVRVYLQAFPDGRATKLAKVKF
jgi:mannose/fructose/N-acetylgalactosamine-specific phosphotransferase system component IIB